MVYRRVEVYLHEFITWSLDEETLLLSAFTGIRTPIPRFPARSLLSILN
jgi:hypothetical protein